jgi:hypothetical protein
MLGLRGGTLRGIGGTHVDGNLQRADFAVYVIQNADVERDLSEWQVELLDE